jgi:hypothetical protein
MVESICEVRLNGNASVASEVVTVRGREVEGLEIDRCRHCGTDADRRAKEKRTAHLLTRDYSNSLRCNDSSSLSQT